MELIQEVEALVSSKLGQIKTIVSIIKLEARLAGLSVYPLLVNVVMLLVVFMAIWLSSMLVLGYGALLLFNNLLIALSVIILVNVGCFLGLLKYLSFNLKNISFEKNQRLYFRKKGALIMSNSRGELIKKITRLNHNLHYQQARVKLHKQYLMRLIYDNRVTLIVTLLPAFLWGWHQGRAKGLGPALKQIVQVGLMTVFTHVKGQFFKHHPLLK